MPPVYPPEDYNAGAQLLIQLGTFWSHTFADKGLLQLHLRSSALEQAQSQLGFYEAMASLSRFDVPVFHAENWHLLILKRSEVDSTPALYGSGREYGDGTNYGERPPGQKLQVELPGNLVDIPFTLQNLIMHPSRVYTRGLDYDVVGTRLVFLADPFADPLLPKRDVYNEKGVLVDVEVAMWIYKGQFDLEHIYKHFGYALGLQLKSSSGYKKLLNSYWDLILRCSNVQDLVLFLAALAGAPLIIEASETVEVVRTEADSKVVITDSHVYRVPKAANVLVTPGQLVHAGDYITDAIRLIELADGALPDAGTLPSLSVSKRLLNGHYVGELVFRNHTVELEYLGADEDGKSIVRFEVCGFPGDVEAFWDEVHKNGKASGATLANLLDQRDDPVGEPLPEALPVQVNPLHFVLQNVFKNHLFLIRARQASFSSEVPGVQLFRLLRDVIPPHTTYVLFMELTPEEEVIDLGVVGDENAPGVQDSAVVFKGFSPFEDTLYDLASSPGGSAATYGTVHVSAKLVSQTCQ